MTIKDKILSFIKKKGVSREVFYKETGLSASNFKGAALKSELGGDKIVKILTVYEDLSPDWLLLDKGPMLREERSEGIIHEDPQVPTPKPDESILYNMYKDLMEEKKEKEKKIEQLTNELRAMERKVGTLEAKLENTATLSNRTAEPVSTAKRSSQSKAFATFVSAPSNEYESR